MSGAGSLRFFRQFIEDNRLAAGKVFKILSNNNKAMKLFLANFYQIMAYFVQIAVNFTLGIFFQPKRFIHPAKQCKILSDFYFYPPFLSFEGFPRS